MDNLQDSEGINCPYPRNRDECLAELAGLRNSVTKWNIILDDIYKAIVGDIHGNVGLQPKVKKLEEELIEIKERLGKIEEFVSKSPPRESVKTAVEKIGEHDKILHDIQPESSNSHDLKMMGKGILILLGASGGIGAFFIFLHRYIIPLLKSSPTSNNP
jgi:hypothetical protein